MPSRHLDRLLCLFSALLPTASGGCGIDESNFDQSVCQDGMLSVLDPLKPATPVDYVEYRSYSSGYGYSSGTEDPGIEDPSERRVIDASGQMCKSASDVDACIAAFNALPLESDIGEGDFGVYSYLSLAWTRGDEAGAAITLPDALEFLGDIDTAPEAALWADLNGYSLICDGRNNVGKTDGGYLLFARSGSGCGEGDHVREKMLFVQTDGEIEVQDSVVIERGDPNCAIGRLPAGLCPRRAVHDPKVRPLGRFFAEVAALEAAAVTAFEQLDGELRVHGAPRALRRWARRSRRDEVRHARVTAALARRFGGRPVRPRAAPWAPRSLAAVAADNAAEGCIRETYGALVATLQARRAADPRVRQALAAIARDETRHAALSWEIRDWSQGQLSRAARRRVARETQSALERLEHELVREHADEVHRVAGMPRRDQARALFHGLRRELLVHA